MTSVSLVFTVSCSDRPASVGAEHDRQKQAGGEEWFTDRARESGLDFVHFNGMTGQFRFPEVIPPGVALLDYDDDGDLDVFVAQGQLLGARALSEATYPPQAPLMSRLYRNELDLHADGTRTLRFTDVTGASGLVVRGYAMGAATGDFNNDGCVDLYVTHLDRSQLFRNDCDGGFTDVSIVSGAENRGWSVSAAFVDYDRDGWLDLFVGNYVYYSVDGDKPCLHSVGSVRDYCPPSVYRAQPDHLYHNNRDGTFTDVTAAAGMGREFGPALGVATADFNGDGWIDIYVANDGAPNQLWINRRDGTFVNTALLAGAALGADGEAKGSMGADAADFDHDGDEDLFVTELAREGHDLYVNDGSGVFEERAARAGLRVPSLPNTGFGAAWFDFDNDGWLDILTVNGAVRHTVEALTRNETFSLKQPKQLFRNLGNGQFADVTEHAGSALKNPDVSRGAAFGDIDNDGDTDVVVANDSGPIRLLINNVGSGRHWLGVRVLGRQRRDVVGARVGIVRPSGPMLWRRARADGSYASANDPRVLVGLGDTARISRVRVEWPGGNADEWTDVPVDRYTTLKEGEGR
ncbi:MAG TPA: CRTAC1 family protein [Vicinamibacterales bacterium]|nr:CRTAC1 family protein [Vicinamibacterales bacterium]